MTNSTGNSRSIGAWFLGPEAENADFVEDLFLYVLRDYFHWRRNYYPSDQIVITPKLKHTPEFINSVDSLLQNTHNVLAHLRRNFPFYSPRYIGHQLSDQTIASMVGYFAGMLYNPNNVTPEAAPVTVDWELEFGAQILNMLGYKAPPLSNDRQNAKREFGWAHITSGGTVANLEALWAARDVRYFPLAVKKVCDTKGFDVAVTLPNGENRLLREIDEIQCLSIKPNESIYLLAGFVNYLKDYYNISITKAAQTAWDLVRESGYSVAHSGVSSCFGKWPPVIFISGAGHYSIKKSADILGIGKDNVELVDVDSHFRMDVQDLEGKFIKALRSGRFPLAVIAIAGTTEEGAVDPIHQIADFRTRCEKVVNHSFWLHIDAAWGGYIRSLITPSQEKTDSDQVTLNQRIDQIREFVARDFTIKHERYSRNIKISWGEKDVCSAFMAFPKAESITVDPHKMGYIPYPCGTIAFRNDRVRHFLTQEAPYITVTTEESVHLVHTPPVTVGPFILEGSKPGAASVACVLSHRVIPPNVEGYGTIIRSSLLAARELHERIINWKRVCKANGWERRYEIFNITSGTPDTNIVCFVVNEKGNKALKDMNTISQIIYDKFTIQAELGEQEYSYSQPFFISRTWFRQPEYSVKTVKDFLQRAGVDMTDYEQEGIFVLRATVMNPYIGLADEMGNEKPYLAEFIKKLDQEAQFAVSKIRES
jgi:glutamate/tyrosine decarboxylase-like PLP-dependent enzyme